MAKVSCILRQWGALLIFVYSWARPAILVASECRGVHVISCKKKKKKKKKTICSDSGKTEITAKTEGDEI